MSSRGTASVSAAAAAGGGRRAFRGRLIDEPAVTLLNTGGRAAVALAEQRV